MNIIGRNIKKLRTSRGMTQQKLSEIVGAKNYTTITKWESGANTPQGKDLIVLSELFNTSVDSILGIDDKLNINDSFKYHYMPATISAGLPIDVEAVTESETIQIPDSLMGKWSGDKEIFFSKINGDSMDRIIPDKSLIAIKPIEKESLKNGDIVVFSNEHDYSVKYYYKEPDKLIFKPHSYSREHHEQHYQLTDNITIHGKVVLYIVEMD